MERNYFIAHNASDVFHYSGLMPEQEVSTGQPFLEYFETLQSFEDRLLELSPIEHQKHIQSTDPAHRPDIITN